MLSGIDPNQFCFMSKKHVLMANLRYFFYNRVVGVGRCSFFPWGSSYLDGRRPQWCISKNNQGVRGEGIRNKLWETL